MKKIIFLIFTLTCSFAFSQNKNFKIPDTLHPKEIRITKSATFGKTEILRIFFDQNLELQYELYEKDKQSTIKLIDAKELAGEDDYNQKFWLKILMTDIHHIADYKDILYKFKKDKKIIRLDNSWTIFYDQTWSLDGEGYQFEIKAEEKCNFVSYPNPDLYFKLYSQIDELKSVTDLLGLIRAEFEIW